MRASIENNTFSMPRFKPGVGSSFANASVQFKKYWPVLLLLTFVCTLVNELISLPSYFVGNVPENLTSDGSIIWYVVFIVVLLLVYMVFSYGNVFAMIKAVSGNKPLVNDLFRFFKKIVTIVVTFILLVLIIVLGFILFIIPGIIFACRLAYVPNLIVDQDAGIFGSIKGSWELTRGYFWKIFLLGLVTACICIVFSGICYLIYFILGGDLYETNWTMQLIIAVLGVPLGVFIGLVFGSLYHAIWLEKNPEQPVVVQNENPVYDTRL